jgi:hypothetical protein
MRGFFVGPVFRVAILACVFPLRKAALTGCSLVDLLSAHVGASTEISFQGGPAMGKEFTVRAVVCVAAGVCLSAARAQESARDPADVRKAADASMAKLSDGDIKGAFGDFRRSFASPADSLSSLEITYKSQREVATLAFGKPLGEVEFIREELVGRSLLRLIYLEKFERNAIVWRMTYYRPNQEWFLHTLSWDDKPQDLFDPSR